MLVVAYVVCHATMAAADPSIIAVATSDTAAANALEAALVPAGMRIVRVENPPPASIGALPTVARELANRAAARGAVWLIGDGGTTTLVAYDRGVDRVLVRALPYTLPLSAAQAAEAARTARTMLRALRIDDSEDEAVRQLPDPSPPPSRVGVRAVALSRREPALAFAAGTGVRLGAPGTTRSVDATLGVVWRPTRVGVAITASFAQRGELVRDMFAGHVGDYSLAVVARVPFMIGPRVTVAAFGGAAMHAIELEGELMEPDEHVASTRFDPALRVGGEALFALGTRIDLGLVVSTDTLLLRQRYESRGIELLVVSRQQATASLSVMVELW